MSKIRHIDFSPDEFLSGTTELTLEETGGYWKVCSLIYSRGGPIADDEAWLARAIVCHVRTWRKIREQLLRLRKLQLVDIDGRPHLTNGRAEKELGRATERIDSAHKAAEASAEKRRLARESTDSNARQTVERQPTADRQHGEKQADLLEINELDQASASRDAQANHQPSTTKEDVTTTRTEDRGRRAPKRAPSPSPKMTMDWPLSDELCQWAVDTIAATNAVARVNVDREFLKFKTHHVRKGTTARGATAAWHTWIFNAIEWSERNGSSIGQRQGGGQPRRRGAAANATLLIAALGSVGDRGSGGGGS